MTNPNPVLPRPQPEDLAHVEPAMRWFRFSHLPHAKAREVSEQFAILAGVVVLSAQPSLERTKAIDALLVAKDAAVRSVLP